MRMVRAGAFMIIGCALMQCALETKKGGIAPGHGAGEDGLKLPAVHTRYLSFAVPSSGVVAEFNPPVLRWPIVKGGAMLYDVRLSQDSTFAGSETLGVNATSWAMFNPHQTLAAGKWYWQYRVTGARWSDKLEFSVTEKSTPLVVPPPARFLAGIPGDHPRVLAEKRGVSVLRSLLQDADARGVLRDAEAAMKGDIPSETDGLPAREETDPEKNRKFRQDASSRLGSFVYRTVVPLCQAWLLSGNESYRERAIDIAMEVARWDPKGATGSEVSDFSDARCMLAMATVFDTFYDHLTAREKQVLLNAVHERAAGFYASWINNQEARLLSGHVWQHILHYFFQAALAVHGEDADAPAWLAYAYELFLARSPILGGQDGGWTEGASYFRMNMETLVEVPLFIKRYTGFDFIRAHPWYVNNIDWMIYHVPPGSSADGFGDNTEEVYSPGTHYVAFAREIAKLTGSGLASWYVDECRRYEVTDLSSNSILRWVRLTKTRDLPMPAAPSDPHLPMAKCFRETGLVSMRSNPQNVSEDLMVAMRSSPLGCYGHFLSDQNAFNILYGGKRTFFRTGYKVTMKDPHRTGWYQHTKSNNSVLIDGEGQPYSTEAFGWITEFLQGEEIAYAMADASNAYSSSETNEDHSVKKFYRHLVLLKPDIIVVYDELESTKPSEWSWLIHSMAKMKIDASSNAFQSTFDSTTGVGKLWSSHGVTWTLADTFDVPAVNWRQSVDASGKLKTYQEGQWHLKAISEKTPAARFLTVLQISPGAQEENIRQAEDETSILVTAGNWKISASVDTDQPPGLVITDQSGHNRLTVYGGGRSDGSFAGRPTITETTDGVRHTVEGVRVMPWYIGQALLHHADDNDSIRR